MAYNWKNAILLQLFLPRGKKLLAILTTAVQKNFEGQLSYWLLVLYCFGTFFVPLGQSNILQIHDYWKVVDMQLITLHCSFQKKFFRSLEIQSSYKNLIKIKNILCRAIISVSFLKMDFEVPKNYIIFFFCVGNSDWIVFSCHKLAIFFHKVGACHNSQRGVAKKQRYLSHTDDTFEFVWLWVKPHSLNNTANLMSQIDQFS